MTFTLALVGRPNVGKSTLFNRLAGKRLAIVDDTPGVTRDWREAPALLFDRSFTVLDTAGLEEHFDNSIQGRMRRQTEEALKRADAILFMIDGRAGLTPMDEHFAAFLRKQKKPVILGVNKSENERAAMAGIGEAVRLGFGDPIALSAEHNIGMHELYQALSPFFPEEDDTAIDEEDSASLDEDALDALEGNLDYELEDDEPEEETKPIKIAIVGRPNVGKSTLLNALVKDNRVMTGPEAGITRDAIAVDWVYKDTKIKLVDTAGMRKKARVDNNIEQMSVEDTLRAIRLAQIVILVVDANTPLEKQDLQIADHVLKEGRALILAVNKWDIAENREELLDTVQYKLETGLAQVKKLPFVTISAKNGRNLNLLMDRVLTTYAIWNRRVKTAKLNRWLAARESQNPAPLVDGRSNRLKYIAQINTRPPTFALWVSQSKELPGTYKRYITNALREDFDLPGVPVRLLIRTSKNPYSDQN